MVHVDTSIANLILGVIIPLITSLIVKDVASPGVKAGANALIAAIGGALTTVIASGGILHWQAFAMSIATVWGASLVSYLGLLKPAGVTGAISTATSNFGIGTPVAPVPTTVTASTAWNEQIPEPVFTPATDPSSGILGTLSGWTHYTFPVMVAPSVPAKAPVVPQGTSWNRFADDPMADGAQGIVAPPVDPPVRPIPAE